MWTEPLRGGAVRGQGQRPHTRLASGAAAGCRDNKTQLSFSTRDAQGLTGLRSLYTPHLKAQTSAAPGAVTLLAASSPTPSVAETVGAHAWWDVASTPVPPARPKSPPTPSPKHGWL